jgi:hypothetical protein
LPVGHAVNKYVIGLYMSITVRHAKVVALCQVGKIVQVSSESIIPLQHLSIHRPATVIRELSAFPCNDVEVVTH